MKGRATMRMKWTILMLVTCGTLATFGTVSADVNAGVTISDGQVKSFHLAIGDFYEVPQTQVVLVRSHNIPDEELPVVFFLARRAAVSPELIMKLRLGGKSWMEIGLQYGISAEAYYVPVSNPPGPPYGKAWGHFKNKKKAEWNSIRLSDNEIVNFVNLKFMSGHYGYSADEVVKQRGSGKSFMGISQDFEKKRTVSKASGADQAAPAKPKQKGKGKGKGKPH